MRMVLDQAFMYLGNMTERKGFRKADFERRVVS